MVKKMVKSNKLNVLFFIILILFFVITVSAIEASYFYSPYEEISIKNPCYYNGSYCSSSATCNITVYDPNNIILVNNKAMTNKVSYFNYSLY